MLKGGPGIGGGNWARRASTLAPIVLAAIEPTTIAIVTGKIIRDMAGGSTVGRGREQLLFTTDPRTVDSALAIRLRLRGPEQRPRRRLGVMGSRRLHPPTCR